MIIVNGFQSLTIITKSSILDVAVLDPPLRTLHTLLIKTSSSLETMEHSITYCLYLTVSAEVQH